MTATKMKKQKRNRSAKSLFGREFVVAAGIEATSVLGNEGAADMFQYELIDHINQLESDYQLISSLGIDIARVMAPWHLFEPQNGEFDFAITDRLFAALKLHGITPILEISHYHTPGWTSFADPEFPLYFERAFRQIIGRYGHQVRHFTLCNEPTIAAHFCGRTAQWPPFLTGDEGAATVMLALADSVQRAGHAIRSLIPNAVLLSAEAMTCFNEVAPEAEHEADRLLSYDLLPWDLSRGAVDENHPWYEWFLRFGATPARMQALKLNGIEQDVLGFAIYPWSLCNLSVDQSGAVVRTPASPHSSAVVNTLKRLEKRVSAWIYLSETSAGDDVGRSYWTKGIIESCRQSRKEGMKVLGVCVYPILTMIRWDMQWNNLSPYHSDNLLNLGAFDIEETEPGVLTRTETELAPCLRKITARRRTGKR
ncbi:hypothetical protein BH10CYA1_BH10CYA1_47140 [soil metagenome]